VPSWHDLVPLHAVRIGGFAPATNPPAGHQTFYLACTATTVRPGTGGSGGTRALDERIP